MKTDLLILGAGPGGYVAAIRVARLGIETTLVEKHKIGGVCLNYGCVPTKVLLGKTALLREIAKGKRFGLSAENPTLDFKRLSAYKTQVVTGLVKGIELLLTSSGVKIISEEGVFTDERHLNLASGGNIEFTRAIIATGSRNREIPGLETDGQNIIDSTGALALEKPPASLLVIGAGAIGLEMGTIFSRLGSEVTVVEMMPEILPGLDEELSAIVRNALTKDGLKFRLGTTVESLHKIPDGVEYSLKNNPEKYSAEKVIIAVGRTPNTESSKSLELASLPGGFIKTNASLSTSITNIKAIGDITGPPLLAHRASHQGIYAVERFAGTIPEEPFPPIPGAVFTEPEFASVGLTLKKAQELGLKSSEKVFPLQAVSRARAMGASEGAFKIVVDDQGKILGVHIAAPNAGDLLAEASLAMKYGLSAKNLAESIHIHPTLSEGLMEAALLVDGRPIHI